MIESFSFIVNKYADTMNDYVSYINIIRSSTNLEDADNFIFMLQKIIRARHDLINDFVAYKLGIDNQEKSIGNSLRSHVDPGSLTILLNNFENHDVFLRKTPDLFRCYETKTGVLCLEWIEIGVSFNASRYIAEKYSKYEDIFSTMNRIAVRYDLNYKFHCVYLVIKDDATNMHDLMGLVGLPPSKLDQEIDTIVSMTNRSSDYIMEMYNNISKFSLQNASKIRLELTGGMSLDLEEEVYLKEEKLHFAINSYYHSFDRLPRNKISGDLDEMGDELIDLFVENEFISGFEMPTEHSVKHAYTDLTLKMESDLETFQIIGVEKVSPTFHLGFEQEFRYMKFKDAWFSWHQDVLSAKCSESLSEFVRQVFSMEMKGTHADVFFSTGLCKELKSMKEHDKRLKGSNKNETLLQCVKEPKVIKMNWITSDIRRQLATEHHIGENQKKKKASYIKEHVVKPVFRRRMKTLPLFDKEVEDHCFKYVEDMSICLLEDDKTFSKDYVSCDLNNDLAEMQDVKDHSILKDRLLNMIYDEYQRVNVCRLSKMYRILANNVLFKPRSSNRGIYIAYQGNSNIMFLVLPGLDVYRDDGETRFILVQRVSVNNKNERWFNKGIFKYKFNGSFYTYYHTRIFSFPRNTWEHFSRISVVPTLSLITKRYMMSKYESLATVDFSDPNFLLQYKLSIRKSMREIKETLFVFMYSAYSGQNRVAGMLDHFRYVIPGCISNYSGVSSYIREKLLVGIKTAGQLYMFKSLYNATLKYCKARSQTKLSSVVIVNDEIKPESMGSNVRTGSAFSNFDWPTREMAYAEVYLAFQLTPKDLYNNFHRNMDFIKSIVEGEIEYKEILKLRGWDKKTVSGLECSDIKKYNKSKRGGFFLKKALDYSILVYGDFLSKEQDRIDSNFRQQKLFENCLNMKKLTSTRSSLQLENKGQTYTMLESALDAVEESSSEIMSKYIDMCKWLETKFDKFVSEHPAIFQPILHTVESKENKSELDTKQSSAGSLTHSSAGSVVSGWKKKPSADKIVTITYEDVEDEFELEQEQLMYLSLKPSTSMGDPEFQRLERKKAILKKLGVETDLTEEVYLSSDDESEMLQQKLTLSSELTKKPNKDLLFYDKYALHHRNQNEQLLAENMNQVYNTDTPIYDIIKDETSSSSEVGFDFKTLRTDDDIKRGNYLEYFLKMKYENAKQSDMSDLSCAVWNKFHSSIKEEYYKKISELNKLSYLKKSEFHEGPVSIYSPFNLSLQYMHKVPTFKLTAKGQRTFKDREIFIENKCRFIDYVLEHSFEAIAKVTPEETITEGGDRKAFCITNLMKNASRWVSDPEFISDVGDGYELRRKIFYFTGDMTKYSNHDTPDRLYYFSHHISEFLTGPLSVILRTFPRLNKFRDVIFSDSIMKNKTYQEILTKFKEINSEFPKARITQNWLQGIKNFTSTCAHSAAAKGLRNLFGTIGSEVYYDSYVHSDDWVAAIGFTTCYKKIETIGGQKYVECYYDQFSGNYKKMIYKHLTPLPGQNLKKPKQPIIKTLIDFVVWYLKMNNLNVSIKKSSVSNYYAEFVSYLGINCSLYLGGEKQLASVYSERSNLGNKEDVNGLLSQGNGAISRGISSSIADLFIYDSMKLLRESYSFGPDMKFDPVTRFSVYRHLLPLCFMPIITTSSMTSFLSTVDSHDYNVLSYLINHYKNLIDVPSEKYTFEDKKIIRSLKLFVSCSEIYYPSDFRFDNNFGSKTCIADGFRFKMKGQLLSRLKHETCINESVEHVIRFIDLLYEVCSPTDHFTTFINCHCRTQNGMVRAGKTKKNRSSLMRLRAENMSKKGLRMSNEFEYKSMDDIFQEISDRMKIMSNTEAYNKALQIFDNSQMTNKREVGVFQWISNNCKILKPTPYKIKSRSILKINDLLPETSSITNNINLILNFITNKERFDIEHKNFFINSLFEKDVATIKNVLEYEYKFSNLSLFQQSLVLKTVHKLYSSKKTSMILTRYHSGFPTYEQAVGHLLQFNLVEGIKFNVDLGDKVRYDPSKSDKHSSDIDIVNRLNWACVLMRGTFDRNMNLKFKIDDVDFSTWFTNTSFNQHIINVFKNELPYLEYKTSGVVRKYRQVRGILMWYLQTDVNYTPGRNVEHQNAVIMCKHANRYFKLTYERGLLDISTDFDNPNALNSFLKELDHTYFRKNFPVNQRNQRLTGSDFYVVYNRNFYIKGSSSLKGLGKNVRICATYKKHPISERDKIEPLVEHSQRTLYVKQGSTSIGNISDFYNPNYNINLSFECDVFNLRHLFDLKILTNFMTLGLTKSLSANEFVDSFQYNYGYLKNPVIHLMRRMKGLGLTMYSRALAEYSSAEEDSDTELLSKIRTSDLKKSMKKLDYGLTPVEEVLHEILSENSDSDRGSVISHYTFHSEDDFFSDTSSSDSSKPKSENEKKSDIETTNATKPDSDSSLSDIEIDAPNIVRREIEEKTSNFRERKNLIAKTSDFVHWLERCFLDDVEVNEFVLHQVFLEFKSLDLYEFETSNDESKVLSSILYCLSSNFKQKSKYENDLSFRKQYMLWARDPNFETQQLLRKVKLTIDSYFLSLNS